MPDRLRGLHEIQDGGDFLPGVEGYVYTILACSVSPCAIRFSHGTKMSRYEETQYCLSGVFFTSEQNIFI